MNELHLDAVGRPYNPYAEVSLEAPSSVTSRMRFLRAGMAGIMLASGSKSYKVSDYVQSGAYSIIDAIENLGVGLHGTPTSNLWWDHAAGASAEFYGFAKVDVYDDYITPKSEGVTSYSSIGRYRQDIVNGTDLVSDSGGMTVEFVGCPVNNVTSGTWNIPLQCASSPFSTSYDIESINLRGSENRIMCNAGNVTGTNYNYSYIYNNGILESAVDGGVIGKRHHYSATYTIGSGVRFYIDGVLRKEFGGDAYDMQRTVGNKLYSYIMMGTSDNPLKFCAQRIYTRPLTNDEIVANHAVDKARFGLA